MDLYCDTEESTSPGIDSPLASGSSRRSPALVRVLQCHRPLAEPEVYALGAVECASIGREAPRRVAGQTSDRELHIVLNDPRVSRNHARLTRRGGRFAIEDTGSKNGVRVGGRQVRCDTLQDGTLIEIGDTFFLYREHLDCSAANDEQGLPGVRTLVPEFARGLCLLKNVARSNVSVLLLGETGTGKEIVARAIHEASGRSGAFIAVNCGAVPRELVESELFGVRRGAYSGATDSRPGYVRAACGGTLFLDEIADLAPASQAALLRVLSTHEVVPIGDARPIPVDFRVIAATNRDIEADVRARQFRADLFARIAGVCATLPPLRQRREDLALLIATLLRRHGAPSSIGMSAEAARALLLHTWPHNVRELENALQAAIVLGGDRLERGHLPAALDARLEAPEGTDTDTACRDRLESLLVAHHGNISAVARAMGKDRIQIRRWIRRFGWDADSFRTSQ